MCRTFKNLNEVFEEEEGCEVDSDQGFLGSTDVNEINSSYQSLKAQLKLEGIQTIFKLDTGADVP